MNELILIDCMEYMKDIPDNAFDLAIVDPPYNLQSLKRKRHGTSRIDKIEKILIFANLDIFPIYRFYITG